MRSDRLIRANSFSRFLRLAVSVLLFFFGMVVDLMGEFGWLTIGIEFIEFELNMKGQVTV
jgi:hypothetical protein